MGKVKNQRVTPEEPTAAEPPPPDFQEKIKFQVLEKIGRPPRLDHVEVSRHLNGKYRVNVWQQPEPIKDLSVSVGPRIRWSFYLTVSNTGEIIHSNPPMTKM
jgi:hypothetical protein